VCSSDLFREVEQDGHKRRHRIRKHPEADFEYHLETRPDNSRVIVKRTVEFERFKDPATGKVYRRRKREMEYEEAANDDGSSSFVAKPKEYEEFQMVSPDQKVIDVKQKVEYELEQVTQPDGSVISVRRGKRRPRARVKKAVRRFVARWPIEDGQLVRPTRRKKATNDRSVFDHILNTPSSVSDKFVRKVRDRQHRVRESDGEYSYDDPDDIFELDEDGSYRPIGRNRRFARALFADATRRKVQRAELEVLLRDLRYALGNVKSERHSMEHQIRLAELRHTNLMKHCHFAFGMCQTETPPEVHVNEFRSSGNQTEILCDTLDDLVRQITENSALISRRGEIEARIQQWSLRFLSCQKILASTASQIIGLRSVGEQLDERLRIARPTEGLYALHPLTKKRIDFEQVLIEGREQNTAVQSHTQEKNEEIRKLKCKIEDQKCLGDMMQKKIANERRAERPNVLILVKQLDALRKKGKTAADAIRAMTIEDGHLKQLLERQRELIDTAVLGDLQTEVHALTEDVLHRKQGAKVNWQTGRQGIRLKAMLRMAFSAHLEAVRRELSAEIQQTKRNAEAVERRSELTKHALIAKGIIVPPVLFE
jgi:hypothetical protein